MYNFIMGLFQSEDEKLAEQYEEYKKKFPKLKLWRKGKEYIILDKEKELKPNYSRPTSSKHNLGKRSEIEAKAYYVESCIKMEENNKPLIGV